MRWLSAVRKAGKTPVQSSDAPVIRSQPTLHTERLVLRPFVPTDAARFSELAGSIVLQTRRFPSRILTVPSQALEDIYKYTEEFTQSTGAYFAIALREAPQELIGGILIKTIERPHEQGELGYWIDEAHSGRGYVTEAARAMLDYGFKWKNSTVFALTTWCATGLPATCWPAWA